MSPPVVRLPALQAGIQFLHIEGIDIAPDCSPDRIWLSRRLVASGTSY